MNVFLQTSFLSNLFWSIIKKFHIAYQFYCWYINIQIFFSNITEMHVSTWCFSALVSNLYLQLYPHGQDNSNCLGDIFNNFRHKARLLYKHHIWPWILSFQFSVLLHVRKRKMLSYLDCEMFNRKVSSTENAFFITKSFSQQQYI